jgi:hypothetical protein
MAYKRVSLDHYTTRKQLVVRLKRHQNPFKYSEEVSLELYEKAVEAVKTTAEAKNALLDLADAATVAYDNAVATEKALLIRLRDGIGSGESKESDAFVDAGGTRPSEIIANRQQNLEDKKKAADDAAKIKAAEDKKLE